MNRQESLWSGEFGDEYAARNQSIAAVAANTALFARALSRARPPSTCIEFGAGTGQALRALKTLYPSQVQHAVEINDGSAAELARHVPRENIIQRSILGYESNRTFDLVLCKTLLIAIHPDDLSAAYRALYSATGRYLLLVEFYNPTPVEIPYRGHADMLWKRDFAGEMMDAYRDLALIDYGFSYSRDERLRAAGGDVNWFLIEKH